MLPVVVVAFLSLQDTPSASSAPSASNAALSASSAETSAANLLGILEERDVKKKIEAKVAKAKASAAAAVAKAAAAAQGSQAQEQDPGPKAVPKSTPKLKANPKPKAKPMDKAEDAHQKIPLPTIPDSKAVTASAKNCVANKNANGQAKVMKKPSSKMAMARTKAIEEVPEGPAIEELPEGVTLCTEWSRSQCLVRVGVHGEKQTCKSFKWGDYQKFDDHDKAQKASRMYIAGLRL